jgi:hypothetical protein
LLCSKFREAQAGLSKTMERDQGDLVENGVKDDQSF